MTTYGYLELAYLSDPYLAAVTQRALANQVTLVINKAHAVNSQVLAEINTERHVYSQVEGVINASHLFGGQVELRIDTSRSLFSQFNAEVSQGRSLLSQVEGKIFDVKPTNVQTELVVNKSNNVLSQVSFNNESAHSLKNQVEAKISTSKNVGTEFKVGVNLHEHCDDYGYLEQPYLTYQYLDDYICVHQRTQVKAKIGTDHTVGSQIEAKIFKDHTIASQFLGKIYTQKPINAQVTFIKAHKVGAQFRAVLYNTTNLRILCDFPSRGVASGAGNNAWGAPIATGQTWEASSTAAGDFNANNLNTDIVEQVWRSNTGALAGVQLKCDTEINQGVFLDTLAILNHNLTPSATVQLQGSNTSNFSSIGFDEFLSVIRNHDNIYYIAPNLPTSSYRYWRILLTDLGNSDNYLQIGTIVFGSSIIFQGECFVDQVTRSTKHFSDKIETEGFTNVSNDRALKYAVGLDFRSLRYNRGNYNNIRGVFDFARTSLKCLWIPTPQYPQRFAVFGKLASIPVETHNVKGETLDFVDFSIELDESL